MRTATRLALWAVRLTGFAQVVLGVLFWTGRAIPLVPVHMTIGIIFVLGLWALVGLGVPARVNWRLNVFVAGWGGVVIALGMTQTRLLVGPMHWMVQLAHLLVGVTAMALANLLANRMAARIRAAERQLQPAEEVRRSLIGSNLVAQLRPGRTSTAEGSLDEGYGAVATQQHHRGGAGAVIIRRDEGR
jgi:hypothetical protein